MLRLQSRVPNASVVTIFQLAAYGHGYLTHSCIGFNEQKRTEEKPISEFNFLGIMHHHLIQVYQSIERVSV
jgi:hypothetical protein